jgi:foldase protein PrsA
MEENNNPIKVTDLKKIDKKIGMSNDKKVIFFIVFSVLVIAAGIFGVFYYNNNMLPVVTYNGGSLTSLEYTIYYKIFAPMLEYYGYPADVIPTQIANKAATDKILIQKAKEANIQLKQEDIDKVNEIFKDQNQIKQFTDKGIDPAKMKELYYNDYIITEYINKIKNELTDDEMLTFLKTTYGETLDMTEYVTKHILFKTTNSETQAAMDDVKKNEVRAKATAVLARALAGEDFTALVTEFSEDEGTKKNGGEYKVYMDDKTVKEYVDAIKALSISSITPNLVETTYGFHIIKLEAKNDNGRLKSSTERETLASQKIDEMSKSYNLKINEELMKKIVESITGKKVEDTKTQEQTTEENSTSTETVPAENTTEQQPAAAQ